AKGPIAFASFILVGLSIIMVSSGIIPPFSEETARAVNVNCAHCGCKWKVWWKTRT
ncbi:hypothetical protein CISIN_1g0024292mg, partial [Citrus sinensis]